MLLVTETNANQSEWIRKSIADLKQRIKANRICGLQYTFWVCVCVCAYYTLYSHVARRQEKKRILALATQMEADDDRTSAMYTTRAYNHHHWRNLCGSKNVCKIFPTARKHLHSRTTAKRATKVGDDQCACGWLARCVGKEKPEWPRK